MTSVRPAVARDAPTILAFVHELAEYERLSHEVKLTLPGVNALLFGDAPRTFCDIAERDGEPIGFALWFYNVSTFEGVHGIYLEDLYVRPKARGSGAGRALLAILAKRCVDEGLGRLEWAVLDWNAPAIGFYDSIGATSKTQWITRQLKGEAMAALAARTA